MRYLHVWRHRGIEGRAAKSAKAFLGGERPMSGKRGVRENETSASIVWVVQRCANIVYKWRYLA